MNDKPTPSRPWQAAQDAAICRLEAALSSSPQMISFSPPPCLSARCAGNSSAVTGAGIGELSEKMLHGLLKRCYAPDPANREVAIGRFIADVYDGHMAVEIQTGRTLPLLPKLREFLRLGIPVTVVCPMAGIKRLCWVDPDSGKCSKARQSGKKERPIDALHLLYPLRELLCRPEITVELLLFELYEYRSLCGYARNRKKGSVRLERVPVRLLQRRTLCGAEDYLRIFQEIGPLPMPFTASDLQKTAKLRSRPAYSVIHLLEAFGFLEKVGKRKNAALYSLCAERIPTPESSISDHFSL